MEIKEVIPNVFHLLFDNKKSLTFTMCRVEEYYEAASDKLQGKVFTWAEFIDEFLDDTGHINYFHQWSGFNVPGDVFLDWCNSFRGKSVQEEAMAKLVLSKLKDYNSKFYIIATEKTNREVDNHELAHSLYYVNYDYRHEMTELNKNLDLSVRKKLIDEFNKLGYSKTVHEDELQAFLSTSTFEYINNRFGMTQDEFDRITPVYIETFSKYNC